MITFQTRFRAYIDGKLHCEAPNLITDEGIRELAKCWGASGATDSGSDPSHYGSRDHAPRLLEYGLGLTPPDVSDSSGLEHSIGSITLNTNDFTYVNGGIEIRAFIGPFASSFEEDLTEFGLLTYSDLNPNELRLISRVVVPAGVPVVANSTVEVVFFHKFSEA